MCQNCFTASTATTSSTSTTVGIGNGISSPQSSISVRSLKRSFQEESSSIVTDR
ncbi:hypothetical protein A2U01_0096143, partial [Trifolium medium]|nr:hypothetical protein [Trifolium medium]